MKKSIRLLSVLLAMVLCFSCLSTGASAAYYAYTNPAGYDALEHPYVSAFQCGSIIIDKIDTMLAEKDMHGDVEVIGISLGISYDLRSIDKARETVHNLLEGNTWKNAKNLANLGDYERIDFSALESLPARNAAGRTDLEIVYGVFQFLYDNRTLIGKLVDGKWDDGVVKYGLKLNEKLGDLHARIKEIIFDALLGDFDSTVCTKSSTVDAMINEFIYVKFIQTNKLPGLEDELVESGFMNAAGLANFKLDPVYQNNKIVNNVYSLVRSAIRAAIKKFAKPALEDALKGNTDTILPLLSGLLGLEIPEIDPSTGAAFTEDGLVAYLVESFLDFRNGALKDYIQVTDDGVSLTANFNSLVAELLETAKGLMTGLAVPDTVEKWDDTTVSNMSPAQTLAYLARALLTTMVDYAVIPKEMPVRASDGTVTYEPLNGYAVATYMLINVMADKMPEKNYMQMIENYKNNVGTPDQQLNPGQIGDSSNNLEPAAFTVLADYMYYFLNGKTTMNIPAGLNFDETLQFIINWAIRQWGGLVRTDNLDLSTTPTATNKVVWKNLDILLWNNVLNITMLPNDYVAMFRDSSTGDYSGNVTRTLLLDNILYTVVNMDLTQLNNLLSAFNKYQGNMTGYPDSGEFDMSVGQFVLTLAKRLLNGLFQSDNALFDHTVISSFEDIVRAGEVYDGKSNLRILVENLCYLLSTKTVDPVDNATKSYGEMILMSALPLVASSLAKNPETARNFDVYPMNGETYTINDLRSIIEAQRPSNELDENMMTNENYFFFGGEDFSPLYKYYNYRTALRKAKSFLEEYDPQTSTQDDLNTIAYRVGYYYDRLALRDTDVTQLLLEINNAIDTFGAGEYESAEEGMKYRASQFTKKTWSSYNQALEFAQSVYRDYLMHGSASIRQSKVSAARELLIFAEKALKFFSDAADYTYLNRMIALANARKAAAIADPDLYISETLSQMLAALLDAESVDTGYDGDDQNIIDEAAMALEDALNAMMYNPQIAKVDGKKTVIDKANKLIYGMAEKLTDYDSYIQALGNGIIRYTPVANGYGTGTEAYLLLDGQKLQSYTVIVFGDLDGDSRADATDANMVLANYADKLTLGQYANLAADADNNGEIEPLDAYYLRQSGLMKYTVDQRGTI